MRWRNREGDVKEARMGCGERRRRFMYKESKVEYLRSTTSK